MAYGRERQVSRINRRALERLREEFDTMQLLDAVSALDAIRRQVADRDDLRPPAVRDVLLELHRMAHKLINEGDELSDDEDLWALAFAIEDTIFPILESAEKIMDIVSDLTVLAPDPDQDEEDEEDQC